MVNILKRSTTVLIALFCAFSAHAQHTQSSYSLIGLGDINWGVQSFNAGLGGLGISQNSKFFVNTLNPALLATNEEAVFQTGWSLDNRNFTNGANSYSSNTGNFRDFTFALPIVYRKWNMGFGIAPVTTVNFSFSDISPAPGGSGTVNTVLEGKGGLDEVFVINSLNLGNLKLGAKVSYLFGTIDENTRIILQDEDSRVSFGTTLLTDRFSFSDVNLTAGAAYKIKLKENKSINFGAFYALQADVRARYLRKLDNQNVNGGVVRSDTLINRVDQDIALPGRFGFGVSYEDLNKWTFGIDFQSQDWSKYTDFNGRTDANLGQSYRVVVGTSFTPDNQSRRFLDLIRYRVAFHVEQTPYVLDGTKINDVGINFGASIPFNGFWGLSHVNLGITVGRRGTTDNNLIRENYLGINLGFSIQDITWFSRGKFD